MFLNQESNFIIIHDTQHNVVALKIQKTAQQLTFKEIQQKTSFKIVALLEVFQKTEVITLTYEIMNVSLYQLNATVKDLLQHFKIAAICKKM